MVMDDVGFMLSLSYIFYLAGCRFLLHSFSFAEVMNNLECVMRNDLD